VCNLNKVKIKLSSQCTDLLTGSKAGGWGGKAKVAVAVVIGTVAPGDAEE